MPDANMKRMRQFLIALLLGWTAACIGAYFYFHQQNIPPALVAALLPAFLVELALYVAPGFQGMRRHFERLGSKATRAGLLTASAGIPYTLAAISLHSFHFPSLLLLVALALVPSFWYAVIKRGPAADLGFLVFMAGILLSKGFTWVFAPLSAGAHPQAAPPGHPPLIPAGLNAGAFFPGPLEHTRVVRAP